MNSKVHWEAVYQRVPPDRVSWFQEHATGSLGRIRSVAPQPDAAVLDVGGGASVLVDQLLQAGYADLTVLDLSGAALEVARRRLGEAAPKVRWIEGDVLSVALPPRRFDVWHDRAVFHFLQDTSAARYVEQVTSSLRPAGHVVIATFAPDGPARCSGLPVRRYSPGELHEAFGTRFRLVESGRELHTTPGGTQQPFTHCIFQHLG